MQLSLFDEVNLAEITDHPDYPGERLVACRNPALADQRARKREELLAATEADLAPIKTAVERDRQRLRGQDKIALRVGKIINRHKVAKHFELTITDDHFSFARNTDRIAAEAALDGIYVIRASAAHTANLDGPALVAAYKDLKFNEAGFKSLKTIDLDLRPIHHRTEQRVRAHVFICMLALYLTWHLRQAWAPICFTDEEPPARSDPVAPARRSAQALAKISRQKDSQGQPVHSYSTLLDELATLTRNTIALTGGVRITKLATPTTLQRRALRTHRDQHPRTTPRRVDRTGTPQTVRNPCSAGGSHINTP